MKIILIFYERDMYLCSSFLALLIMGFSNSTADPDSAEEQADMSEVVPPGMPHLLLLCLLLLPFSLSPPPSPPLPSSFHSPPVWPLYHILLHVLHPLSSLVMGTGARTPPTRTCWTSRAIILKSEVRTLDAGVTDCLLSMKHYLL